MAHDYRLNPFTGILNTVNIVGEIHKIPTVSPYWIRLNEVPLKDAPSSITLTIDGAVADEVASIPNAGEFWPDYSAAPNGDEEWNTGTILFNPADAGKNVLVSYKGTGTLVDVNNVRRSFTFLESGSWLCPEDVLHVRLTGCGGGGGGGDGYVKDQGWVGGCGGSGGYASCAISQLVPVVPGTMYQIVVGAGGVANASGGNTIFGNNLFVLAGGGGGERYSSASYNSFFGLDGNNGASNNDNNSLYGSWGKRGVRILEAGGLPSSYPSVANGRNGSGFGTPGSGGVSVTYGSVGAGGRGTNGFLILQY